MAVFETYNPNHVQLTNSAANTGDVPILPPVGSPPNPAMGGKGKWGSVSPAKALIFIVVALWGVEIALHYLTVTTNIEIGGKK